MVPMGQNVHQALGWMNTASTTPMAVVTVHMSQNTRPQWSKLPGFCRIRYTIKAMSAAKTGQRNQGLLSHAGMFRLAAQAGHNAVKKSSARAEVAAHIPAPHNTADHAHQHNHGHAVAQPGIAPAEGDNNHHDGPQHSAAQSFVLQYVFYKAGSTCRFNLYL